MQVAALVLGIIATLVALIPVLGMYAIPLALLAVVFGALGWRAAKKVNGKKGLATAGVVLGLVGVSAGAFQYTVYKEAQKQLTKAATELRLELDTQPAK